MRRRLLRWTMGAWGLLGLLLVLTPCGAAAEKTAAPAPAVSSLPDGTLPADWVKTMTWRSIGPANMGGRITAIAVYEADPSTYWIATASGGLVKTVNNGVTFEHQFDQQNTVSIGDVAVAPSDRNIVWVGTGESNPRNSVSYGDGVYKSTDGGKKWTHMGLNRSYQIGKILIHPKDPNIVYVGALGRLYGPNEERGLFKTTDGGKSWTRAFYVDDKTGVIDMRMHPAQPDTLIVATWERQRDGHDSWPDGNFPDGYDTYDPLKKWGPGSGLWKSTDGGKSWKRLTSGLPANPMGRIGLDWYLKDPNVVYAIIDCQKIGMGTPPRTVASQSYAGVQGEDAGQDKGAKLTQITDRSPAAQAGLLPGDVVVRFGAKPLKNFNELTEAIAAAKVGDKVKVAILRDEQPKEVELTIGQRPTQRGFGFAGLQGEDAGDNKGARLTQVTEGGPAEKAGLKEGDVVKKVGEQTIESYRNLLQVLRESRAGDKVKIEVARGNQTKVVEVTLAERTGFGGPGGGMGGPGGASATRPYRANYGGQRENVQAQQGPNSHEYGGVYRSADGGETWTRLNSVNPRPMYFSQVRVDPSDERYLYVLGVSQYRSSDGGKSFRTDVRGIHADQHALWINPRDGRHMIVGTDGGFYVTYDRMANWDHMNNTALGQFYHVAVCTKKPYWVYGGLQDNGTWGGPSRDPRGAGPLNEDWISIGSGDGYRCQVDPNDPDLVYYESQNGGMGRYNLRTGERASLRPVRRQGQPSHRFNWNTPFILSSHNSRIFYCAGEVVFRSLDRGNDLRVISPEITRTKRGSATALAESPRNPEVLWAGTDDGFLWVTRDGGKSWTNVTDKVGLPAPRWVSTIEASRFVEGRAYVCFDAHRSDDDEPYLYVTEDYGQSWKSIRSNLPAGSSRCLREDIGNPNLLYCGTEFALFVSLNRGASWTKLNNNLPTVAVHEVAIHPTAGEIVAATHGRSLWILDVTALRQLTAEAMKEKAHLYKPGTVVRYPPEPGRGRSGRRFVGQTPRTEAAIYYSLTKKAETVALRVVDIDGQVLSQMNGSTEPGLHRLTWSLTRAGDRAIAGGGGRGGPGGRGGAGGVRPGGGRGGAGQPGAAQPGAAVQPGGGGRPGGPGGGRGGVAGGVAVPAGAYRVVLIVDGQELAQSFRVEGDAPSVSRFFGGEEEEDEDRDR